MSFLLTAAKVNINIENCKLYARKSDDFVDKWIVIRKWDKKGQAAPDLFVMVSFYSSDSANRITLYRFLQDEPLDTVLSVVRFLFSSLPCLAGKACILQRTSGRFLRG